jgi:hypothetical protein
MVESPSSPRFVSAMVPDADVPAEKVRTRSSERQEATRKERFLKGPILFPWIRGHVLHPVDRLVLILRAYADMLRSDEMKVTADILRDAGIEDRKTAYRAIDKLEASGALLVRRKRGRRPIVRLV